MKEHTQKRTFLGMFFARGMFFFASKHGLKEEFCWGEPGGFLWYDSTDSWVSL
jgi:hypothetical protein